MRMLLVFFYLLKQACIDLFRRLDGFFLLCLANGDDRRGLGIGVLVLVVLAVAVCRCGGGFGQGGVIHVIGGLCFRARQQQKSAYGKEQKRQG